MSEIQIKRIKVLRGPNIWARRPVLELLTDIGKYEELPSDRIPGFAERLIHALPSLYSHHCSEGRPGGFLERLRMGTWMGHILEHVTLELQQQAGMESGYGRTRGTGRYGEYHVVIDYKDPEAARMCVDLAVELLESLAEDRPLAFDLAARLAEIREVGEENVPGPSTRAIVDAARRRGIPWYRLNNAGLVQLGHGRRQKRIQAAETSLTSNIGVEIASDKQLTKSLLEKLGIPVPAGQVVRSADRAWEAAQEIGLPVVVKPADGNQGRAVSVNLSSEEQVRAAFALAQEEAREVIVEQFVEGEDYRLLVVNGEVVAAAHRQPAQVVADGLRTVRELVEAANADPLRGSGHGCALTRIRLDGAAELVLTKQGLTWESVPAPGQVVLLRDCSNLSTGGTATDVTDDVHPETATLAVLAARTLGLDIAGIDIVCRSIRRSLAEEGAIVEVNAAPGLRMHLYPSHGRPRPVGDAIVDMLFPPETTSRIPLVAVTGTNGKTTVTRMIAHVYSAMKEYVGMTTTDGIYFDGVRRVKGDCAGPGSAEAVLQHPLVSAAVLETARGGILRSGLGWDRCSVGVVLNVAPDHLGMGGIDTIEQLARVKRVVVEEVSPDGYAVLNAEDPLVTAMAEQCRGRIIYFATDPCVPIISSHLASGQRAVYLRDGHIILAEGSTEVNLVRASDIPATHGGLIGFQVQNALAAAAAAWGAGVPLHYIRLGLRTFQADDRNAPGRFNMFTIGEARVIVDYAHNAHALRAVQGAVAAIRPERAIGVVTMPGDRRDEDVMEAAAEVARTFAHIIVREDDDPRGRERGEICRLLGAAISRANPQVQVTSILDEKLAVTEALSMLRGGDLLMIFADKVDAVLEIVREAARNAPELPRPSAVVRPGAPAAGPGDRTRTWGVEATGPGEEESPFPGRGRANGTSNAFSRQGMYHSRQEPEGTGPV